MRVPTIVIRPRLVPDQEFLRRAADAQGRSTFSIGRERLEMPIDDGLVILGLARARDQAAPLFAARPFAVVVRARRRFCLALRRTILLMSA